MPRFYCPTDLTPGALLDLPAGAARHVQVLRLQPGDAITLFNGQDVDGMTGEFAATVTQMGRSSVQVRVGEYVPTAREPLLRVHLAVGMPANERMDWLVEKATELGVASVQPLVTERSVLRLSGERADKKQAHWQSIGVAACEQCGGNRVPLVHPIVPLAQWLASQQHPAKPGADAGVDADTAARLLLSLHPDARALRSALAVQLAHPPTANDGDAADVTFLSGPEGGLSPAEERAAMAQGFVPVSLGRRVLRAETAALVALAALLT